MIYKALLRQGKMNYMIKCPYSNIFKMPKIEYPSLLNRRTSDMGALITMTQTPSFSLVSRYDSIPIIKMFLDVLDVNESH